MHMKTLQGFERAIKWTVEYDRSGQFLAASEHQALTWAVVMHLSITLH